MNTRIALMARCPIEGNVKTRLAAEIGASRALEVHVAMLKLMCTNLSAWFPGQTTLWVDQATDHPLLQSLARQHGMTIGLQCRGGLGQKMAGVLSCELKSASAAMVIGADCLGVTSMDLQAASAALIDSADVVIGPASDGGYYLLGLKRLYARLFEDMEWGTDTVYQQTVDRAAELGLRRQSLTTRSDVDSLEDLRNLDSKTLDLLGLGSSI